MTYEFDLHESKEAEAKAWKRKRPWPGDSAMTDFL